MRLGEWGEQVAEKYLKSKDYKILKRNYRSKFGEIDIIAEKDNLLIFVEVKTRANEKYGLPCESITPNKIRHIRRMANYFILEMENNGLYEDYDYRIDVIEILVKDNKTLIHQIENAC